MDLAQLHGRLRLQFKEMRSERARQPVYLIEHGLTPDELEQAAKDLRKRLQISAELLTDEWTTTYLPLLVLAVETANEVGGAEAFWPALERRLNWRFSQASRSAVGYMFRSLSSLTLVAPPEAGVSPGPPPESWPIAHAMLAKPQRCDSLTATSNTTTAIYSGAPEGPEAWTQGAANEPRTTASERPSPAAQPQAIRDATLSSPVLKLEDWQRRLVARFEAVRDARAGAVFFIEHGLDRPAVEQVRASVRTSLRSHALDSSWWERRDLPLLVAVTEVGYRYRGSGTDFWPLLESDLEVEVSWLGRQRIKDLFVRASDRFRAARPPITGWAQAFHLIAWPITHALLPLEFHRPFAMTLANLRASVRDADDGRLYRAVQVAASFATARFATLLEDVGLVVSLTRSLLGRASDLSPEIVDRLSADLEADAVARRGVAMARSMQRATQGRGGAVQLPAVTETRGSLQLRRAGDNVVLEARFPSLDAETTDRLRRSLRRRRFAPRLWGVTARVPADQLLSGLPFLLKVTAIPASDTPLFPDLDPDELDAQDLAVLHGFELQLAPPHLFAVSAEGEIGRLVQGTTITAHRIYWALLRAQDEAPKGVEFVGDVGPMRCFELDPGAAAGAKALAHLGYDVRAGVSVRFAGAPPLDRGDDVPTFVAGDDRLVVPQRLADGAALLVDLDGRSSSAGASEVVRVVVEAGDHRIRISNSAESRDYAFRGTGPPRAPTPPVRVKLQSEERTVQALLGGRLGFVVDGAAPLDGLELTIDLEVGGSLFSSTGPLGPVPQPVSPEHPVMKALLAEDVRELVSTAPGATLRARVGHLGVAEWVLDRMVRPCWWDLSDGPKLLSEGGPLSYGVVGAEDPVSAPAERPTGDGTYLLAPIALDQFDFDATAPFATLCLAPRRAELRPLPIVKPRLERRRRGARERVGLEDLAEAYLRWSLAETRSAIGDLHRGQVTARLEQWMTEVCCGPEWAQAEDSLPRWDVWGLLEAACQEMELGTDPYLDLPGERDAQVRRLAVEEIRRSIPTLWARIGPPSDLDDDDYVALDRAYARAYEVLADRYRKRGQDDLADALARADPGESPEEWQRAFARVREQVELRELAAMLLPSNSAKRFVSLDPGGMTVDEVADELTAWASSSRKAFAGAVPTLNTLKAIYALWVEPEIALTTDWRAALDTLLTERAVARATRYLALRARQARWRMA